MLFYVYELVAQPGDQVLYVGKGCGERLNEHLKIAARQSSALSTRLLYRELHALLASGRNFSARKIFETEDEHLALLVEADTIRQHGFDRLLNSATHAMLGKRLKVSAKTQISSSLRMAWKSGAFKKRALRRKDLPRKSPVFPVFYKRHVAGYKGVSIWSTPGKSKRWLARIWVNGRSKSLGYAKSAIGAAKMYDDASQCLHGTRPNGT